MRGSIVFVLALLGVLTLTSAPQANPLIPAAGIAAAAAETDMIAQAHYRRWHHRHWRGHHHGWRHRRHHHRY